MLLSLQEAHARPTYVVQLLVEAARVADRLPALAPPPQGRRVRLAVAATRPFTSTRRLKTEETFVD